MDSEAPSRREILISTAGIIGTSGCLKNSGDPSPPERSFSEDPCVTDPKIDTSDPLVNEINARSQARCVGVPFAKVEPLSEWTADSGNAEATSGRTFSGSRSVALEAEPNEGLVARYDMEGGVDLSEINLSATIHPGEAYPASNVIVQLFAPDMQNRIDMWQPLSGDRWVRVDFGPTNVAGSPDLTDVRTVRILSLTDDQRRVRFYVDHFRATPKLNRGYVILTFDDNLDSQYETALPVMEEFSFPGVLGVVPWRLGSSDTLMSTGQVDEMHRSNWEIVSHPQQNEPLPTLSEAEQRSAIRESKQWLVKQGYEDGARFVIWPYGQADATTLDIAERYHELGFRGGDHPSSPPYLGPLSVSRVNGDDINRTYQMIDYAARFNQITVVMYHDIGDRGPHVSASEFEETLQYIDDADVSVITPSKLVDEIA